MNKRTKREMRSYFLSFVLMISMVGAIMLSFGKYSLFSSRAIVHSCERIGYYSMMKDEIEQQAFELGIPYGIHKKDLKKAFTVKKIRADVMDFVFTRSKSDEEVIIDTSPIGKKIADNVKKNYEEDGSEWTDVQETSLQEYIIVVGDMYQSKIEIPGIGSMATAIQQYNKVLIIALPICLILLFISGFLIVSMRRYIHHALRFIAYSIFGTAITLIMTFAAGISNGFIYRINVSAPYMRKFFTYLVGHAMLIQILCGIFVGVAGLILVFIIYRIKESSNVE